MSKQIRVSDGQYEMLGRLSKEIGVSRVEVLSNVIGLAKLLVESKASALKVIYPDGSEKELLLTLLVGLANAEK